MGSNSCVFTLQIFEAQQNALAQCMRSYLCQNTLGNSTESADSIAPSSVSLSLYQADISDLVGWASAITDKSIVLHPSVSGQVTVIAGEPMPREDAYQLFLTVLELHGFTVVESANALTVIPAQLGREQSI